MSFKAMDTFDMENIILRYISGYAELYVKKKLHRVLVWSLNYF